jgi:arylsulfatase A-like enzyme
MGDDHSAEVLGAYGNWLVRTPNLDQLASQSLRFNRAYANSPVCTPSRQSIITGKLPHASGVTLLRTPLSEEEVTIADHLKNLGFQTGAVGKMHFNSSLRHGFDFRVDSQDHRQQLEESPPRPISEGTLVRPRWRPFQDPARIWLNAESRPGGLHDKDSEGVFFVNQAIEFWRRNMDERFCLWVSFREPHSPFNFPIEYAGRYQAGDMPLPAVGGDDGRWVPEVFKDLTEEEKRGIVASYYTSVEYLDKNVGLLLAELERLGLRQNTLVVYVGDQGYLLGDHGRFEKHTMWEPAVRAPLLVRVPGQRPGVSDALVEFIDLVPTILDVLGVRPMKSVQGESFAPLLTNPELSHREHVFSEFLPDNMAMVRTEQWKYIFTSGRHDLAMGYETGNPPSGITHRLYDVIEDPDEFRNLATDFDHAEPLRELQNLMVNRFQQTHPLAGDLPDGLSIDETLAWFCEPPEGR